MPASIFAPPIAHQQVSTFLLVRSQFITQIHQPCWPAWIIKTEKYIFRLLIIEQNRWPCQQFAGNLNSLTELLNRTVKPKCLKFSAYLAVHRRCLTNAEIGGIRIRCWAAVCGLLDCNLRSARDRFK